jgi:hypothetical protein
MNTTANNLSEILGQDASFIEKRYNFSINSVIMRFAKHRQLPIRSTPMPKGYSQGKPLGGKRQGSGRKKRPDTVRVSVTISKPTQELLRKVPRNTRTAVLDSILNRGILEYFKESAH